LHSKAAPGTSVLVSYTFAALGTTVSKKVTTENEKTGNKDIQKEKLFHMI